MEKNQSRPSRYVYQEHNQNVLDSIISNQSELKVELLFHFLADFDTTTFDEESWMYTYRSPDVYRGEYISVHFNSAIGDKSRTIILGKEISFCTGCLDTNQLTKVDFNHFGARPFFDSYEETLSWSDKKVITSDLGRVVVTSKAAKCADTGSHLISLGDEGKELKFNGEMNLILLEDSTMNELFVIQYACCRGLMNIFRVTDQ